VIIAARSIGAGIESLAAHRVGDGPAGLVVGYAGMPETAIARGVELLAEAI
jgi:hypothetical protein